MAQRRHTLSHVDLSALVVSDPVNVAARRASVHVLHVLHGALGEPLADYPWCSWGLAPRLGYAALDVFEIWEFCKNMQGLHEKQIYI